MSKIWFTSDTHFNQERTLELSKRPFDSVQVMNDTIIDRWNSVVGKDDTVYHLGDFGDFTSMDNLNIINSLNGNIILILGNYELNDINNGIISESTLRVMGFKEIHNNLIINIPDIGDVFLTHEPINCIDIKLDNNIKFNLFGHIHKLQMVKSFGLNVGTDCHNYTPIDVETVKFYYNGIINHYDNNVFFDTYNYTDVIN